MIGAGHALGDTAIIVFLLGDTLTLQGVGSAVARNPARNREHADGLRLRQRPDGDLNQPNKAFAAALILLVMVLIINVVVDISAGEQGN